MALRGVLAPAFWWLVEKHFKSTEILDEQSLANLRLANEFLKEGSIVLTTNHQKIADAPVIISMIFEHLSNAKFFAGPAGLKHFDLGRDSGSAVLLRALRFLNVYATPVVQHNDSRAGEYSSKKAELIEDLKKITFAVLGNPGGVYGIAPEGTRNPSGELQQGRPGVGSLRQFHDPEKVLYLPIAVIYPSEKNPHLQIKVGTPKLINEVIDVSQLPTDENGKSTPEARQVVSDALMMRIAELLPEEMRGYYA